MTQTSSLLLLVARDLGDDLSAEFGSLLGERVNVEGGCLWFA
jgi:hypothetical protein